MNVMEGLKYIENLMRNVNRSYLETEDSVADY